MVLFLFASLLFAEDEQSKKINADLLEFLGAWDSKDESWQVILDERLWQENEVKEGASDE